ELEQTAISAQRPGVVVELLGIDVAELLQERDQLRVILGELALTLEHLRERTPLTRALVQAGERVEGFDTAGVDVENIAPELDANIRFAQLFRCHLRDLETPQRLIARIEQLALDPHHLD